MTKVGIITFHNNENRGAILQGYSLCRALKQTLSANVDIIEYRTASKERLRRNKLILNKRPWTISTRLKDRHIVENFINSKLPTSTKSLVTDDHKQAVAWIEEQNYDVLVTGSDEVWKVISEGSGGAFSRFFPNRPFPNLYLLDPEISATKVAYAASANKTDLDRLESETKNTLQAHISAYDFVSVRDRHTERLVNSLGIEDVHRVPDPTLLIDLPKGDAATILTENGIDLDKPILGIHSHEMSPFDSICEHYRERGYQIVAPATSPYADLELVGKVDPFEYFAMYEHFDMVVTTSLHSTIFSLKNRTPFVTIDVDSIYAELESKTYSLLEDFSFSERHINAVNGNYTGLIDRVEKLERSLDEDHIENCIEEQQERGIEFLEQIQVTHGVHN
ncbi:polysaccharide pyruvyl transferase family protein [Haloprofundus salilacus]|uniref:polysaccharide pyruvyl transferase family protein n=1 Tax=Haloprofundus salilacus TaxID=2876190 RepID=UPI001CCADFC2|nr:polysaccharide pyruvyl transferase family protein [Haloprofundus salilacus]